MLALLAVVGHAFGRRRLDDVTLLAATVSLALLGNAFICGVISGPHDRYGRAAGVGRDIRGIDRPGQVFCN
jgi:hypothetical protein